MYTYRNNLREGVVFLFVDRAERVLIETRPNANGQYTDSFFPNGSVEVKDKAAGGERYLQAALLREIAEEFGNKVTPLEFWRLGSVEVPEIAVIFDVFVIREWTGEFPEWTIEDGERFGKLSWVSLSVIEKCIPYESATRIVKMLTES
jgi:8-oxo-dGTP pyrophosphatase MutT (NUDIX family)